MAAREQQILEKDIFIIESGGEEYLVYAPLSGFTLKVSGMELGNLEKAVSGSVPTAETVEVLKMLRAKEPVMDCASPDNIDEMTILLNQRCNFSCSYCYSARGRSNAELGATQIHRAMDFFIKNHRGHNLGITFSGGGDPVLSFDKFQESVIYAETLACKEGIDLDLGLVTNGSTLSDSHIKFLKDHHVNSVLSFEILEDVHNKQRSHYDIVVDTLYRMCDAGLPFGIRCTVTPLNVCRQCEMVETLHNSFPQVKSSAFEVVLSRELFKTEEELSAFYENFIVSFFRAKELGEQYGISIDNTIFNNVACSKLRACTGKLVVTPDGTLSACSRVSLAKEPYYDVFRFGKISPEGIAIDYDKYDLLMNRNALYHPECDGCIAQWNCGGGCLLARHVLGERMALYCAFIKSMTIETLKYRLR